MTEVDNSGEASSTSELLTIFAEINTAKQWTTLLAFTDKVNGKLNKINDKTLKGEKVYNLLSSSTIAEILLSTDSKELQKYGIWVTSFGKKFMPIVITNSSHYRIYQSIPEDEIIQKMNSMECTCTPQGNTTKNKVEKDVKRFYGSHDYSAGRHSSTQSSHKANCLCWTPATTGHLHSWRRGYEDDGESKDL